MLRDKNLIPLSHQHQHALALCVRIERASPISADDLEAWQAEIAQIFESEIHFHFAAEEEVVFPAAAKLHELQALLAELISEHRELRAAFHQAQARSMSPSEVSSLAQRLSMHIRKEERQLFEQMQQLLSREELVIIGGRLDAALKNANQSCTLPSETTRLRSAK